MAQANSELKKIETTLQENMKTWQGRAVDSKAFLSKTGQDEITDGERNLRKFLESGEINDVERQKQV
jgi:hypothetical protein